MGFPLSAPTGDFVGGLVGVELAFGLAEVWAKNAHDAECRSISANPKRQNNLKFIPASYNDFLVGAILFWSFPTHLPLLGLFVGGNFFEFGAGR